MLFWIGLLAGVVITVLVNWLTQRKITIRWYEWVLGGLGLISIFATVQHYFGSLREHEYQSAWMGSLIFGVIGLILLLVAWQLVARRAKQS
nr:hypothetical protein [Dehalococcoides mccartyi]